MYFPSEEAAKDAAQSYQSKGMTVEIEEAPLEIVAREELAQWVGEFSKMTFDETAGTYVIPTYDGKEFPAEIGEFFPMSVIEWVLAYGGPYIAFRFFASEEGLTEVNFIYRNWDRTVCR